MPIDIRQMCIRDSYNMVRIMVGTLLDINRGKIVPGSIPQIIESKDRNQAGATAAPEGLYLNRVNYDLTRGAL